MNPNSKSHEIKIIFNDDNHTASVYPDRLGEMIPVIDALETMGILKLALYGHGWKFYNRYFVFDENKFNQLAKEIKLLFPFLSITKVVKRSLNYPL